MATQLPGARALGAAGGHRVVQAPDRCGLWLWHPPPLPVKGGWVLVTKAEPMWVAGCSGHRQGAMGHGWVVNVSNGLLQLCSVAAMPGEI